MKCNVVMKSDRAGKKKMVKACEGGKEKIIHFGATGYGHNYSSAARKSFRARHKCKTAKSKLTARYWACKKLWAGPLCCMARKKLSPIKLKKSNQGKFTAWAKKNMPGKSVCSAASAVMKNTNKFNPSVVKMANFAKNFGCSK